jgi:sporulation protein YlmC with PRC-barrel domain
MIKHHIAACLMATALVAVPAFAQTDIQPATPPAAGETTEPRAVESARIQAQPTEIQPTQAQPTQAQPQQTEMVAQPPGHDLRLEGRFIAQQSPNHQLASDLMGVRVIGADDVTIGSVKDLVMDGENRLVGIVVGVGGFLGIGEKSVGIPVDELRFVPDVDATAAIGTGDGGAYAVEEIRITMTREQLDDAPQFGRLEAPSPAMTTPGTAPGAVPDAGQPPARAN